MQRLYKFFLYLLLIIFAESFILGLVFAMVFMFLLFSVFDLPSSIYSLPFSTWARAGLSHAIPYTLVQFASVVFLFRQAYHQQKKFTLKHIVRYLSYFILVTLVLYIIYFAWQFGSGSLYYIDLVMKGPRPSLPFFYWFPFAVAWITLYIFQSQRINKQPAYGRQD